MSDTENDGWKEESESINNTMNSDTMTDPEIPCGEPCSPYDPCPECEAYWQRMRDEGFWKDGEGWTEKAQKEWRNTP